MFLDDFFWVWSLGFNTQWIGSAMAGCGRVDGDLNANRRIGSSPNVRLFRRAVPRIMNWIQRSSALKNWVHFALTRYEYGPIPVTLIVLFTCSPDLKVIALSLCLSI